MLPIVPLPPLKQKRKNSKTTANISTINNQILSSPSQLDKSKNYAFKIDTSSKIINNNNDINININKKNNNKINNININKIIKIEKIEKTENKETNENLNLSFIDSAIINFSKGLYNLSLQDALKSMETEDFSSKANYIAFLCYLEMYDIESAEKLLVNKNRKLKNILEAKKRQILSNINNFKSYPKYINFLQYLYKNNSFFPKIEIQFYTDDYRGVVAKNKILKNEIIMAIPKECLITLEVALNTSYGKKISAFMYHELNSPKHCLLSSFLLFEQNNPLYKYYFDLLPNDYSNFPIFYTEKELDYLKGSPFLNLITNKKMDMRMDYNKLCEKIEGFKNFTFEKFCQARVIVSSRVFGISINKAKTDALVPFADLLNHRRPRQTQWFYDDNKNAFIVQAIEEINPGQEIFDSYGKKTNSRFLLNYGFALENNDMGEYQLTVVFNNEYPLFDIKKKLFKNEFDFTKIYNLNNNFQESQILELISYLRFLLYDDNINNLFKTIFTSKNKKNEEMTLNYYFFYPINRDIEIKVLKQLKLLCEQALAKYPTTMKEDQRIFNENKNKKDFNFNYRNCLLLLMSEKKVLNYYINFCEYCLKLLKTKKKIEVLGKITKDFKENDYKFNFYIKDSLLKLINEKEKEGEAKNFEKKEKLKEDIDQMEQDDI
jgi:histone-lysine N-methyltransferase SETD3